MRKLLLAVAVLAGCAAPGADQTPPPPRAGTGAGPTQAELVSAGKNTDDVVTYGMSYNLNRYSPLSQINRGNVKRLVPVWSVSLQNDLGEQAQPLVYDGVVYVSNARWTYAIDALTGKMIWRTAVDYDPDTPRVVCCGVSNEGVAIYEGKVFRTTLDAYVVALDQKTGKHNGDLIAVDQDTGAILWSFRTSSGINAQPITWTKNGKQYITVLSGIGGNASGRRGLPDSPTGGSVWTFALFDQ